MASITEMIKARQAAQTAAAAVNTKVLTAVSAVAGSVPTPPPDLGLPMASAASPDDTIVSEPTEAEKAAILAALTPPPAPLQPGPPGSYRACNLQRFHKANGMCVYPDADGFFIPKDAEEAQILAHHATKGWDMVEFQDPNAAPE